MKLTNHKKITLEFDASRLTKQKRVPLKGKGLGACEYKHVTVNNPKAWEIITVENSSSYVPGQCLNKKQVQMLCKGVGFDVIIGQPGQFKMNNNRY